MTWLDDVLRIEGMVRAPDIEVLYEYASKAQKGIVEIGSYLGQSTVALAYGSRKGHLVPVWAIDSYETYTVQVSEHITHTFTPQNRGYFMQNIVSAGVADIVRLISLPSTQVARCWDQEIDLLFVDGKHDYDSVLSDLKSWYAYIPVGGHILLHDYDLPSVRKAVKKFLSYGAEWACAEAGAFAVLERCAQ
jgi:predicted O-methyltransferase YrrM